MFAGFGGFPFSSNFEDFGSFSRRQPRRVPTFKYYSTLGVAQDATPSQIRKAFQQLAIRLHPDKGHVLPSPPLSPALLGGDPEKFKEISEAYEVLRDENKRRRYDQVGDEGPQEGPEAPQEASGTVDDLFDELMGMYGGRRTRRCYGNGAPGPQKSRNMTHTIHVPLEEIYNSATRHVSFTRKRCCVGCKGTGFKGAVRHICPECHGQGVKVAIQRFVNGVVQEVQTSCGACGGSGLDSNPIHYCQLCCGSGEIEENKTLDVNIEQGMKENHRITFSGEASCTNPLMQPGDVIVTVCSEKNPEFQRRNADLLVTKHIHLCDALCGMEFTVKHLDGRELLIQSLPGEVIKPGQVKCIEGEGMPVHGQPSLKGNLYISLEIDYPEQVSPRQQASIRSILGSTPRQGVSGEPVAMRDIHQLEEELRDREQFGRASGAAYDSDDSADVNSHRQRVRCSQQ